MMKLDTILAQGGSRFDKQTGAVSTPVYQSSTYQHPSIGKNYGYDYSRSENPTRLSLEQTIALAEGGAQGYAFSSGMAAVASLFMLLRPGDHVVCCDDIYGGTYRFFEQYVEECGIVIDYIDPTDLNAFKEAINDKTKMIFIETPSNPMMKITDIKGVGKIAKEKGILFVVDNTFMSPYLQRPLEMGADIVLHSGSKYLGGHNDVIAGLIVTKTEELGEKIYFYLNCAGAILAPMESWLLLRGMKTLSVRMQRAEQNATALAHWLQEHPQVEKVFYPGLSNHPQHALAEKQQDGFGAMLSFSVKDPKLVPAILHKVKVFIFAESLGGVESLITYPLTQTHGDIPSDVREKLGITDTLLRVSVGIEDINDLKNDLNQAMEQTGDDYALRNEDLTYR